MGETARIHFRALTVADALRIYGTSARLRLAPHFRRAGVAYPPKRIARKLFTLAADTGPQRIRVIIAPNDLRVAGAVMREDAPLWVAQLYRTIAAALAEFPVWLESNSTMDIRGMPKSKAVFIAP